jgi:hypothetical protein
MKVKIRLHEAVEAMDCLNGIRNHKENSLSVAIGWDIDENIEALKKPSDRYNKEIEKLATKFGKPVENLPGQFQIKDPEGFNQAADKIAEFEVSVDITPLNYTDLKDCKMKNGNLSILKKAKILQKKQTP